MDGVDLLIALLVVVAGFALWLVATALTIWGERRIIAKMQTRIGPNRIGPLGILQTLADGIKLFFKEDITPRSIDRWTYFMAPMASAVTAMLTFAVIPFGGSFEVAGREVTLQIWDPEIGMLWILAMSSIGVYGIVLAGWSSGSKYPLLGGVRSSAQMISYELAMGLGLAAVFVWVGSLRVSDIVDHQTGVFWSQVIEPLGITLQIPSWNIGPQLFAFILFFGAAVAETQRPPFDLPEAEGELVAGFVTEYSGAKFAMFFLGEFMQMVTMSAVVVTLFFGGPAGPLFGLEGTFAGALLGTFYFVAKTFVFVFVFVWLRGTLPRLRYDRLMDLGWKVFLPLGLLWVMATAAIVVAQDTIQEAAILQVLGVFAAIAVAILVLSSLFGRRVEERVATSKAFEEDLPPELPPATDTAREASRGRGAKDIEIPG